MSRIPALLIENASENIRPTLESVQKGLGFLPNTFRTLAHSPAALNGFMQFNQAMGKSSLSASQREAVALAASQVNGCDYCLAAHSLFAQKAGLSASEIRDARHGQLNEFARFALHVTESRGQVTDVQLSEARQAGLNDAQIVEIIAQVALLTFTNYLNNVAATDIDWPAIED
ncbi:peroxidase-related enzyme [Pseudomonas sp. B14-6]|uniref:carboxymuconolactone decarboxylase family protein n=1 Tax=Pseudomonas sp. B14-6 TaxID=2738843 RepID=UPI00155E1271|nr:peroxidase-related enzyme [Pseudomonas sp. B14-6]QKG67110.1 peroxidase-related enzyme [Pseudomonas sp. B14-6]